MQVGRDSAGLPGEKLENKILQGEKRVVEQKNSLLTLHPTNLGSSIRLYVTHGEAC